MNATFPQGIFNTMRYAILVTLLFGAIACKPESKTKSIFIEASFRNRSGHDLDWVRIKWAGPDFSAGILSTGVSATTLDLKWPDVPSGTLTFVDDKTRQPFSIALSFASINEQIKSGGCRAITILILDYNKAEVVCGSP